VVTLLFSGVIAATMPVGENLTMLHAQAKGLDYGRIRLWGSLTFIVAATLGGRILDDAPPDLILGMVAMGLLLTLAACIVLPDARTPPPAGRPAAVGNFLRQPLFLLFLGATSLIQVSHMIYYGFATLHWQAAGLSGLTIGWLWAEGVIAEILLFAVSGRAVTKWGPGRLILVAALAGIGRWAVLGLTTDPWALSAVQWLHGATFGACHLGAMHFIQRAAPAGLSARAQGLYSSLTMGLAPGLAMLASGNLYGAIGGAAFFVMAALSGLGAVVAWRLAREWRGGELRPG
jgi:MFS transporter, PPP family, 3-phenylpropionic acid transporter